MSDIVDSLGMFNSSVQFAAAQMGASDDKDLIREENQKSRDFTLEMWNRANEYNLPSAVMQRYKDAGLNPNLIYDNGTNNLAAYQGAPSHSAPNMNSKDMAKYIDMLGGVLQASQVELNRSQAEKNQAEAYKATAEGRSAYVQANVDERAEENGWLDNIVFNTAEKVLYEANIDYQMMHYYEQLFKEKFYDNTIREEASALEFDHPVKVVVGTDPKSKKVVYADCEDGYQMMIATTLNELVKKGMDVDIAFRAYDKITTEIKINQATEQNIITDTQLKLVEQEYYKSLSRLNDLQRQKIFSDMQVNNAIIKNLSSISHLNYTQAEKFTNEAVELLRNGKTQRFKTLVQERFGSGAANQIINLFYNAVMENGNLHVDPRDMTPYYQPK